MAFGLNIDFSGIIGSLTNSLKSIVASKIQNLSSMVKTTLINKVNQRYKRENGDWYAYFKHLLSKKKDTNLTPEKLIRKLKKQKYLCALSGVKMTCSRIRGQINLTNASIDRIKAGGAYTTRNIQLVCRAINSFRGTTPLPEYLEWCKKVTRHKVK